MKAVKYQNKKFNSCLIFPIKVCFKGPLNAQNDDMWVLATLFNSAFIRKMNTHQGRPFEFIWVIRNQVEEFQNLLWVSCSVMKPCLLKTLWPTQVHLQSSVVMTITIDTKRFIRFLYISFVIPAKKSLLTNWLLFVTDVAENGWKNH